MARKGWAAMVEKASDKEPEYIGSAGLAFAAKLLSRQHAAVVRMVKARIIKDAQGDWARGYNIALTDLLAALGKRKGGG